jgi:hypothetical protein
MPDQTIDQIYPTFFQAFWLGPVAHASVQTFLFSGPAENFSYVVRNGASGLPQLTAVATLADQKVTLTLSGYMSAGRNICLYLFGSSAEATAYAAASAAGWTAAELAIINDPNYFGMVPDVSMTPQNLIRAARAACNPSDPNSVAQMNTTLLGIYAAFTAYNGHVLPSVTTKGLKGATIAAPGNPP